MIRGWALIAKALGLCCVDTALTYARRRVDPLPVMMTRGAPHIEATRLEEWVARKNCGVMPDGSMLETIEGVDRFADYFGVDRRTIHKWASDARDPLPLFRRGRRRCAFVSALVVWRARQTVPLRAIDGARSATRRIAPTAKPKRRETSRELSVTGHIKTR